MGSDLTERVATALARAQYPGQRWPDEFECPDNLRADAEAVLDALGLADLDAAANRLWDSLAARGLAQERAATETWPDLAADWRGSFIGVLEAALTATEVSSPAESNRTATTQADAKGEGAK